MEGDRNTTKRMPPEDPRLKTVLTAEQAAQAMQGRWMDKSRNRRSLVFCIVAAAVTAVVLLTTLVLPSLQSGAVPAASTSSAAVHSATLVDGEILLYLPYVSDPCAYGDTAAFSGGRLTATATRMKDIYLVDMVTGAQENLSAVQPENDEFISLRLNENYLAMVDVDADKGSGIIKVMDRTTREVRAVANCPYNVPKLALGANCLAWVARTGQDTDCLYLYDLTTSESVALYEYRDSQLGVSPAYIYNDRLYWVVEDNTGDRRGICMVRSISLDGKATEEVYQPGMYLFGPQGNGEAIAWLDSNRGEESNLYVSVDGGAPRLVAQDVVGYGLGDHYVAYCKNERMYLYLYAKDETLAVNKPDQRAVFSGVYGDTIFWFDITSDTVDRDILLYTKVTY